MEPEQIFKLVSKSGNLYQAKSECLAKYLKTEDRNKNSKFHSIIEGILKRLDEPKQEKKLF